MNALPPCVIFEDDHLLVVNKPAGMNTHSPDIYAGEGIYEWLRNREPRWGSLAIIHRLDKTTSGVMVFGKTPDANRSLTSQFAEHLIRKKYLLEVDGKVDFEIKNIRSSLVRVGDRYESRPVHKGGELAETNFRKLEANHNITVLEAQPLTGKTHQIRSHAAALGIPIIGDSLYGGAESHRVHLHAAELEFSHPISGLKLWFKAPIDFAAANHAGIRNAFIVPGETNSFRMIHGASDGYPKLFVEKWGDYVLAYSAEEPSVRETEFLSRLMIQSGCTGIYHKVWNRKVRTSTVEDASPKLINGASNGTSFIIRENAVRFEMSFAEGYSVGLFLDQRENRRRFIENHIAPDFPVFAKGPSQSTLLNTFAYTCGFSVCAALAGASTTSLDLSKKYLDWGRRNFTLNGLDDARHDFIYGDVFDWMHRLHKKGRTFDAIVLDPPTFSQSKQTGRFSAESDYGRLMEAALPLLNLNGVILASTNAAKLAPQEFVGTLIAAITKSGRKITRHHYAPQPPDFPISREEPAYLKTFWMQVR